MTNRIYLPANRSNIDSFYVMELLYNANKLQANGKKIFHLELGEPIPKTPKAVLNEASRLSRLSLPGYTPSNGIEELRERISEFYKSRYNLKINSDQIFVTTGSSGAFLLTFLSCFDKGSRVAIFNPVYPAYRNILKSLDIDVIEIFVWVCPGQLPHLITPFEFQIPFHAHTIWIVFCVFVDIVLQPTQFAIGKFILPGTQHIETYDENIFMVVIAGNLYR